MVVFITSHQVCELSTWLITVGIVLITRLRHCLSGFSIQFSFLPPLPHYTHWKKSFLAAHTWGHAGGCSVLGMGQGQHSARGRGWWCLLMDLRYTGERSVWWHLLLDFWPKHLGKWGRREESGFGAWGGIDMKDFPLAVSIWSCLLDFEVEMLSRPLTESGVQDRGGLGIQLKNSIVLSD